MQIRDSALVLVQKGKGEVQKAGSNDRIALLEGETRGGSWEGSKGQKMDD